MSISCVDPLTFDPLLFDVFVIVRYLHLGKFSMMGESDPWRLPPRLLTGGIKVFPSIRTAREASFVVALCLFLSGFDRGDHLDWPGARSSLGI